MEENPSWQADSHSASQDVHRLLWDPKVHYCVHNSLLLVSILRHVSLFHTL